MFEDFLVAALAASLLAYGGTCRPPDRHHLDTAGRIAMRPDLVWHRDGHPSAVVGAKHKVDRPSGLPDADLYQVLGYCTALDLAERHLVYAKGNAEAQRHRGGWGLLDGERTFVLGFLHRLGAGANGSPCQSTFPSSRGE